MKTIKDELYANCSGVVPSDVIEANRNAKMREQDAMIAGLFVTRASISEVSGDDFEDFMEAHVEALARVVSEHSIPEPHRIASHRQGKGELSVGVKRGGDLPFMAPHQVCHARQACSTAASNHSASRLVVLSATTKMSAHFKSRFGSKTSNGRTVPPTSSMINISSMTIRELRGGTRASRSNFPS